MSKAKMVCFIIAGGLVALGLALFTVTIAIGGWDFNMFGRSKFETTTHDVSEDFIDISVDTKTADVIFLPSEDGKCKVVACEKPQMKHSITIENGTLSVKLVDTRKWYDHISLFSIDKSKITVYLPKKDYASLLVKSDTGDIEITESFTFESIDVGGATGDVNCFASASGAIYIKESTGDIRVEGTNAESLHLSVTTGDITVLSSKASADINISVSTGDTELKNVTCNNLSTKGNTGDESLNNVIVNQTLRIERTTGDVEIYLCDAAQIAITTDTGDVTGTLLTEKVFITQTDTGKISVPDSVSGGRCEITTDTGDIKIRIA